MLSVMVTGREGRVGTHCQSQQFPLGVLSIYLVMVRAGKEKIAGDSWGHPDEEPLLVHNVSLSIRS